MLNDQADEIHELRRKAAEVHAEIERRVDALVITAFSESESSCSERDLVERLRAVGFELSAKDAYPLLARLASEGRLQREGPRYRAIRPEVLQRQLTKK